MTYCLGFLLDSGLVLASDSRTNAGVDYISCYSKMHVLEPAPDRLFVLMAAGNLGTTQAVLNRIRRDIENHGAGPSPQWARKDDPPAGPDLLTARYLFEVADYIGRLNVMVQKEFNPNLRQAGASGEASFILGGQIAGQPHGLYMIYPQGNAIMATADTPFLQIGETKYGKPPLDYIGHVGLSLEDAARLCLVSEIVTRRSNLTVGPPFEIALVRRDSLKVGRHLKLDKDAAEITRTMEVWTRHMKEGVNKLPRFPWEQDPL
ncbi:20S proteasome subunit A/B [Synechococcus sp. CCY 9618]|uniref:20S proteasome subunit A/B n=1 Tax=Synechococcus sp. CCY 9618 TaxID=2815602 RepID=UPI001C220365|nr:20S proteasome subunit A/B [Synechococcus sp. CCY 9618]